MSESPTVVHAQENVSETPDVIVITGMSGAGRTEALHTFEDLGYFVIGIRSKCFSADTMAAS
ncbi:MAG: RNase adapter RapZ, partial [Coriobacteriales bacterium]|nr:RNase adapter RapZ [Coriobacteriales bacterium]